MLLSSSQSNSRSNVSKHETEPKMLITKVLLSNEIMDAFVLSANSAEVVVNLLLIESLLCFIELFDANGSKMG